MTYKRAVTGSPLVIPAGAWNDMLAMIEKKPSRVQPRDPQRDRIRDWIQVCNTTDAELPIFSVLGLDGPLVPPDPEKDLGNVKYPILKGVTPKRSHRGRIAVLQDNAVKNEIVWACISGVTYANVDMAETVTSNFCDVYPDRTDILKMDAGGNFPVLWKDEQSELALVGIFHHNDKHRTGILQTTFTQNASRTATATVKLHIEDPDVDEGILLSEETVKTYGLLFNPDTTFSSGRYIILEHINGRWEISQMNCPD